MWLCFIKYLTQLQPVHYYPPMGSIHLVIPQKDEPPALHERAMDNLKYIRETMERATAFTAISGWGLVAIGVTALAAPLLSAQQKTFKGWLTVWVAEAVIALLIAGWSMDRKARAAKMCAAFSSASGRFAWRMRMRRGISTASRRRP